MSDLSFIQSFILVLILLLLIITLHFTHLHLKARSQFPGPPVKNFWTGNLDQTMADNVHEMVGWTFD